MTALIVWIWFFGCPDLLAQGNLTGRIIDSQTGQPVPFATLFLANTSLGTAADAEGNYALQNILPGKYDLIVSSIGYTRAKISVDIQNGRRQLEIKLNEDRQQLKDVEVTAKRPYVSQKVLRMFEKYFLGNTINALKCRVVNIHQININFDDATRQLTASAPVPIIVENRALGYRVYYSLDKFTVDFARGKSELAGFPRFEEIKEESPSEFRRWQKQRSRAYHGSMVDFMRSLRANAWTQNKFQVFALDSMTESQITKNKSEGDPYHVGPYYRPITENDLFAKKNDPLVRLKIVYRGESEEPGYSLRAANEQVQTSYLQFPGKSLVVHENGYYENPLDFYMEGYLAWSEKIAEQMPWDYQPVKEKP